MIIKYLQKISFRESRFLRLAANASFFSKDFHLLIGLKSVSLLPLLVLLMYSVTLQHSMSKGLVSDRNRCYILLHKHLNSKINQIHHSLNNSSINYTYVLYINITYQFYIVRFKLLIFLSILMYIVFSR